MVWSSSWNWPLSNPIQGVLGRNVPNPLIHSPSRGWPFPPSDPFVPLGHRTRTWKRRLSRSNCNTGYPRWEKGDWLFIPEMHYPLFVTGFNLLPLFVMANLRATNDTFFATKCLWQRSCPQPTIAIARSQSRLGWAQRVICGIMPFVEIWIGLRYCGFVLHMSVINTFGLSKVKPETLNEVIKVYKKMK